MAMLSQDLEPGSHVVHVYADDGALASSIAEYAADGLRAGQAVVLIAEPDHLDGVRLALKERGIDLDSSPGESAPGIRVLDSAATLFRFMEGGRPVPERFADVVGGLLREASTGRAGVRAYGEMVETLWRQGNVTGALALEELWNQLARELSFTLYCAYRDTIVANGSAEVTFDEACGLHSAVVSDGTFPARRSASARFAADDRGPGAARAFVRGQLAGDGEELADAAALVISELATNAARHGGAPFSVSVTQLARTVRIAVRDSSEEPPVARPAAAEEVRGRGLHLVSALATKWGSVPRYDGKLVWAELER